MCGIVGSLVINGKTKLDEQTLINMRDSMHHRGPDGGGLWMAKDQTVALGHRRLAIVDLTPEADQPMHSNDGAITLVFNGEIYNHADIRKELMEAGHTEWQTNHSDTEALLQAYAAWGIEGCIKRLRACLPLPYGITARKNCI